MQPVLEAEPIEETRGDDWIWPFAFADANGAAVDLTGCVFDNAEIRWSGGTLPLSIANGRLAVDTQAGVVTVTVARGDNGVVPEGQRSRAVLPIIDTQNRKSTLLIVPIKVIVP